MTEYDPPEIETSAEDLKTLRVLNLRRLDYDFSSDQLILEGQETDPELLIGYKTYLLDLPTINDTGQIEGAMIGAAGHVYIAESLLTQANEILTDDAAKIEAIENDVSGVMRKSFRDVYPDLLDDQETSQYMLWSFQVGVRDGGIPTFVTFGQCACLGYDPYGMELGLPVKELSFHNIDYRVNDQLARAQITSIFSGLAAYSKLIQSQ